MSHQASAVWKGTLKAGAGNLTLPKANIQTSYDFQSRFETGTTTTPEELLAGAISSCFSMYLSALFSNENLENTIHEEFYIEFDAQGRLTNLKSTCSGEK